MKYVFLIIGLLLTLGAVMNTSLFYVGIGIMLLSMIFMTKKENSITKITERKSLIERLDSIKLNVPDKAVTNIVEDAVAVTAKIAKGAKADVSAKSIVAGTLNVMDGMTSVFENKK